MTESAFPILTWSHAGQSHQARWRSEAGLPPPVDIVVGDDRLSADAAWRLIQSGQSMLWQGDYQNARQLLQGFAQRVDRQRPKISKAASPAELFAAFRRAQGERAQCLARLLVPLSADYRIPLRRGQDVQLACQAVFGGAPDVDSVLSLRELLSVVSAHEWRKKGVPLPVLQGRIYPHYGVFSPVRGEYLDLIAQAALPPGCDLAFDIGTGSGVLAALLARRGIPRVVATDLSARALACAGENITRLGLAGQVELLATDLFPPGQAALVVCNPPWVPAQPSSPIEYAVYDPDSRMLRGFLAGLPAHLRADGEGWLIISDLAEHLGLRSRDALLAWIAEAGLRVLERLDTKPQHPKTRDQGDALHQARAAEVTSLWRLTHA